MYAIYNKEKIAEDDNPCRLIKSLRLIVSVPEKKIQIFNNNILLVSSKFYSKLDKWSAIYYRETHSFQIEPLPSDMDDNDETEFYL